MTARLPHEDDPELMPYQRIARLIRRHREQLGRTARHLAREMALCAGPDGAVWYTSVEMLADELAVTAATVRRARTELVAAGVLEIAMTGGGTDTNVYRFRLPVVHTPRASARGETQTPRAPARGDPARGTHAPRALAREIDEDREEEDEEPSAPIEPWVLRRFPALVAHVAVDAVPTGATWDDYG